MSIQTTLIPFPGGDFQAIRTDERGDLIELAYACGRLGVDYLDWRARLSDAEQSPYAVGEYLIEIRGNDGRLLRGFWLTPLAMIGWLFKLNPSTVRLEYRPRLKAYQVAGTKALHALAAGQAVPNSPPINPYQLQLQQAQLLFDLHGQVQEASANAQTAMNMANRCHGRRTVRAYLTAWKIPMDEWNAARLGVEVAAAARTAGIPEQKVPDTRHYAVHAWPDDFMTDFFTRKFGPKPT